MLLELIRPVLDQYDFNGFSKFVVNASELANHELFDELYNCSYPGDRENCVERARLEHQRNHSSRTQKRSRNKTAGPGALSAGQSLLTLPMMETTNFNQVVPSKDLFSTIKRELRD